MAIIKALPGMKIIRGFRGILDFYFWMGIPCVRRWPKKPTGNRSQNVVAQWPAWSYVGKAWDGLPADIKDMWNRQASGTSLTGRDLFTRGYLSGWAP